MRATTASFSRQISLPLPTLPAVHLSVDAGRTEPGELLLKWEPVSIPHSPWKYSKLYSLTLYRKYLILKTLFPTDKDHSPPHTPFFYTQPKPDKQHRMREGGVLNIIGYGMIWGSGVMLVLGIEQGQRTFRAVSLLWAVCLTKSMYVLLFCFSFVDGVRDSAQGCTHVRQIAHHWTTPQSLSCWYL